MALSNLAISYTSWWQGSAVVRWGYPVTLVLDAAVGMVMIALLPFMKPAKQEAGPSADPVAA
jgi:uncharacterized protein YqjF (DUF2071 family)